MTSNPKHPAQPPLGDVEQIVDNLGKSLAASFGVAANGALPKDTVAVHIAAACDLAADSIRDLISQSRTRLLGDLAAALPERQTHTVSDSDGDLVYGHESKRDKGYNQAIADMRAVIDRFRDNKENV